MAMNGVSAIVVSLIRQEDFDTIKALGEKYVFANR